MRLFGRLIGTAIGIAAAAGIAYMLKKRSEADDDLDLDEFDEDFDDTDNFEDEDAEPAEAEAEAAEPAEAEAEPAEAEPAEEVTVEKGELADEDKVAMESDMSVVDLDRDHNE